MKKIISVILCSAMLLTVSLAFSGCGLFGKKAKGTDGAKILLARERLDENYIGQKASVWSEIGSFVALQAKNENLVQLVSTGGFAPTSFSQNGNTAEWSNFGAYSDIKDANTQFIDPIDEEAARFAETVVELKQSVGVTNKWISLGGSNKVLLIVKENSETVVEISGDDCIRVNTRYTREDAKCVYEMYTFMDYGDGETGRILEICVPGEHYEYMFRHSNGFDDFFVADKSNGYWTMNRFDGREFGLFFDIAFVKDGLGYGSDVTIGENGRGVSDSFDVFLPNEERDLLEYSKGSMENLTGADNRMEIAVYLSNVTSGISKITTDNVSAIYSELYGGSGMVYMMHKGSYATSVVFSNGKTIAPRTLINDKLGYLETVVTYSPEYNGDCYVGKLIFEVSADTFAEGYGIVCDYLTSQGVSLYSDRETVLEAYEHASLIADDCGTYTEWNGYQLDSMDAYNQAISVLDETYAAAYAVYESVKDNDTATKLNKISGSEALTPFTYVNKGNNSYDGGVITVNGLTLQINDTDLLENGNTYSVRLGLALLDANGEISSMNTVPLMETTASDKVKYDGGKGFEISKTGEFRLPVYCSEGSYAVVAYIATTDERIRVTEMAPIAIYSADTGTFNSDVMDVTVSQKGEELNVRYDVKLTAWTTSEISKDNYTYEEIRSQLLRGVLANGYPVSGAIVQTESGEDVSESGVLGGGVYRLKFLTPTAHGYVEAYMYCDFN